jgi:SAM-dependent methyltransferase
VRFSEFLDALPATVDKFCFEITVRTNVDKKILLKKLLRGAFDAGRYNNPDRQQMPAPFMPNKAADYDRLEVNEMEKWSGLWRTRDFRATESPVGPAKEAVTFFNYKVNDTVIDFGCGRGAALTFFQSRGLDVTGLDIASNALDERAAAHLPLIRACLWNLPDCLSADYGYCCNVLEYIPEEKLEKAVKGISRASKCGFFVHVSFKGHHAYGKTWEWWHDTLDLTGRIVEVASKSDKHASFIVT